MKTKFDPEKHHRRSVRLKEYDYTQGGAYFITICTAEHERLFGGVVGEKMILNPLGEIVREEWLHTEVVRDNVKIDEYVVMPNHFHAIIFLTDRAGVTRTSARSVKPQAVQELRPTQRVAPTRLASGSIGAIIGQFKSQVTKRSTRLHGGRLASVWQRNYHEHIIRDEEDLRTIREYIVNNPLKWHLDRYYVK